MVSRRTLFAGVALGIAPKLGAQPANEGAPPRPDSMTLALHQNTSAAAGFRGSLEGWARAGIREVELTDVALDDFLARESIAAARRLLDDLGLTPVSAAAVLPDLWIPGPERVVSLDTWRRRCEQYAALGLEKIYCPSITSRPVTSDDYAATPACMREVGDIAESFGLTAMVEFARTSTHLATLPTTLEAIRSAGHAHVRPMLDFFHFWAGLGKFEDLDLLEPGELAHAHFQDVQRGPRELIDNDWRLIPGDGVAPVERILRKLAEKGYRGPLSVELFRASIVERDPAEMAGEIRRKCETVMRSAGVLAAA